MAVVVPFRGVLYNPELIQQLADVVAPPYDVISADEQEGFYQRHPNNVIRLILGKARPEDNGHHRVHTRAADHFNQWLADKVLVQDEQPAFYLTCARFSAGGNTITRYGIIGSVQLEPFDKGIVLPHERTFSKVKTERLQLMKACHSNFSPIFGLYSDTNGVLKRLQDAAKEQTPDMDLVDSKGIHHKLWRITDETTLAHVTTSLKDRRIYIADGHHRYETALNYRQWVKENTEGFGPAHPANYVMMSLSSLEDPGMVIFAAHRLLRDLPAADTAALLTKAAEYFDIQTISTAEGVNHALKKADAALTAHADQKAIGVFIKPGKALHILVLKKGVMEKRFGDELPAPLLDLDVTVLTRLLMEDLLGFDQARLDDASKIGYCTTSHEAVHSVLERDVDVAFILNPTKIEQVQRVAEHGLIMPRKSTYFYPKVLSGQVFSLLK
jgi:uncharacterized protein (DUF1015 family)